MIFKPSSGLYAHFNSPTLYLPISFCIFPNLKYFRAKLCVTVPEICALMFLAEILLECKGSSIGVLVSGPKKKRQEVAAICSSGLANNLHFDSISFSW